MNTRTLLVSVLILVSVLLSACAPAATPLAPTIAPATATIAPPEGKSVSVANKVSTEIPLPMCSRH